MTKVPFNTRVQMQMQQEVAMLLGQNLLAATEYRVRADQLQGDLVDNEQTLLALQEEVEGLKLEVDRMQGRLRPSDSEAEIDRIKAEERAIPSVLDEIDELMPTPREFFMNDAPEFNGGHRRAPGVGD